MRVRSSAEKLRQIREKKGSLQKRITNLSEALENVVVQESFFMEELNKVRELKKKEEERWRKERAERKNSMKKLLCIVCVCKKWHCRFFEAFDLPQYESLRV